MPGIARVNPLNVIMRRELQQHANRDWLARLNAGDVAEQLGLNQLTRKCSARSARNKNAGEQGELKGDPAHVSSRLSPPMILLVARILARAIAKSCRCSAE